jgi:aldehyde dehydrogenase (NAD+)
MTAHGRAQVLYYIAENLDGRREEFVDAIARLTGQSAKSAVTEMDLSIDRIFTYAAWADKFDGAVHGTAFRGITIAIPEPLGVIGIGCPDANPLLGFLSVVMPAIAMGNRVVAIPSKRYPLAATAFYQVLDTSDVPAGVVNIVTGPRRPLLETLAAHDDVAAVWHWGDPAINEQIERLSSGNLKQTWVHPDEEDYWLDTQSGQCQHFLRHATQTKNIWIPFTDEVSW